MAQEDDTGLLMRLPLFLLIWAALSLMMFLPAAFALINDNHPVSQSFFYSGTLGLFLVTLVALALGRDPSRMGTLGQLAALFATFIALPLFLAIPFHDALRTTSFLNAYVDMVSAITTTGFEMFDNPARLPAALHLYRGMIAWLGGLLMWIAAAAILAPLSLGGFEVTARGAPGRDAQTGLRVARATPRRRLLRVTATLTPVYAGLTGALWVMLLIAGEDSLPGLVHAMSILSTSGLSPIGGLENSAGGIGGEVLMFLFMFFALSRLTFSADTVVAGYNRLDKDPEFRIGLLIVLSVPLLLFARHWLGALQVEGTEQVSTSFSEAARALWGSMFTVMSFLSTTGFESANWDTARQWSGVGTPGLILMGLALIGGGVATTAGGVKLLRVFALYLNGLREMERLVHPSSISGERGGGRRIRRDGAFIAWIFFMLFALSLALVTVILAALGVSFEQALVLSISALSTTGPLVEVASDDPVRLIELSATAKLVICAAMVLGRLETLAIIALFTPDLWRR